MESFSLITNSHIIGSIVVSIIIAIAIPKLFFKNKQTTDSTESIQPIICEKTNDQEKEIITENNYDKIEIIRQLDYDGFNMDDTMPLVEITIIPIPGTDTEIYISLGAYKVIEYSNGLVDITVPLEELRDIRFDPSVCEIVYETEPDVMHGNYPAYSWLYICTEPHVVEKQLFDIGAVQVAKFNTDDNLFTVIVPTSLKDTFLTNSLIKIDLTPA